MSKVAADEIARHRSDWETPPAIFEREHAWHRFTIDVAANARNTLLPRYFDVEKNGLAQNWKGERVWMHPPHDRPELWAAKADWESYNGTPVVGLMPVRTEAQWWHDYVFNTRGRARVKYLTGPLAWRLHGLPIAAAVEKGRIEGPRGAFAIIEWRGR